ncbi:hypothetical protein NPIL_549061 [Nephila pilipes]|uniref:Uncharacterized protein n=1 Tax=Nephila pilipes TaxID=299642 RepID=A0A8X6NUP9_NEPPI|nr:hypothetical protein NPIL_549061 [Nephila pilipes]
MQLYKLTFAFSLFQLFFKGYIRNDHLHNSAIHQAEPTCMVSYVGSHLRLSFTQTCEGELNQIQSCRDPPSTRNTNNDKAAAVTDRFFEKNPNSISFVPSTSKSSSSVPNHRCATELLVDEIKTLRKEVADIRRSCSRPKNTRNGRA